MYTTILHILISVTVVTIDTKKLTHLGPSTARHSAQKFVWTYEPKQIVAQNIYTLHYYKQV